MVAYVPNDKCCGIKNFCEPLKRCPQHAMYFLSQPGAHVKGEIVVDDVKCDGCGECLGLCRTHVVQLVSWGAA
jgi:heterodisulfide reductase subunit A-like polyferredoxin